VPPDHILPWTYDDGGRRAAGFRGDTSDCSTRAVAIATERPYQQVYDELSRIAKAHTERARKRKHGTARTGVSMDVLKEYMRSLGWRWIATMTVGGGCTTRLRRDELPVDERLVVRVSKHLTAVIDGTIHDTHDPGRGGTRCVYGYWYNTNERT